MEKGKFRKRFKWTTWSFSVLGPAAYLLYLHGNGLPLHDEQPLVNLVLRLLLLDLLPVLWVFPWFLPFRHGYRGFLMDLSTQGRLQPLPLSPPILALLLFINESTKAIEDPTTALPVSVKDALWMEAAAALMAWLVLSFGTRQNRPQTPSRTSTRLSGMLAAATIVGGMAYFLRNHCDISRLLVVLGIGAWVFQKILDKARIRQ